MNIVEIKEIVVETPSIKTFYFDQGLDIYPGQFVMVWIPGEDEYPMSLPFQKDRQGITVRKVGPGTEALHSRKVGDRIGIRGPYGNGYDLFGEKILAVIGGIGGASVLPAIVEAAESGREVVCALGGRTEKELLFLDRLSELTDLKVATDDGSAGHHGFVTDLVEDLMHDIDLIITCGPEVMMKRVFQISKRYGVPIQASLERYMKCGIGVCGSCVVDGLRVCAEGPVLNGPQLADLDEFGKCERDPTGKKVPLDRPKPSY